MVDANSPILPALLGALFVVCGALAYRASRRRGMRSPASARKSASFGSRIVVYVGATAVMGIILLFPGGSSTGRLLFFALVLPVALWAAATDAWIEHRIMRRGGGSHD